MITTKEVAVKRTPRRETKDAALRQELRQLRAFRDRVREHLQTEKAMFLKRTGYGRIESGAITFTLEYLLREDCAA